MTERSGSLRLGLWAQRSADRLPAGLRPAARRMRGWIGARSASSPAAVADWCRPLIERDEGVPTPATTASATSQAGNPLTGADPEGGPPRWVAAKGPRCLLVTQDLDAGGMGAVVSFLALGLPGHGIDTSVLHVGTREAGGPTSGGHGRIARELRQAGVPITFVSSPDEGRRWLGEHRPAVVNAHIAPDWVLDAATEQGIPFVETLHLGATLRDWSAEATRSAHVSTIIAVSDLLRTQYLLGNPSFPGERVVTIPNAVDRHRMPVVERGAARARLGLRDEFLFVSLARYSLEKNSYALVSAFLELAQVRPDAHLLIAGRVDDPAYAHQIRLLCDRSPHGDRVHLRTHHPDPWTLLTAADAFALDSFFEGWALASMEALCTGTPVIMSEVGGAREQVGEAGEGGYLVPNALGGGHEVTWEAIRAVRFADQQNRAAVIEALGRAMDERPLWHARRVELAAASRDRFDPQRCLRAHASVLAGACTATTGAMP